MDTWQCQIPLKISLFKGIFIQNRASFCQHFSTAPEHYKNPKVLPKRSADLESGVEGRPRLSPQTDLVLIVDELEADRPAFCQDLPTVPRVLFDQTDPPFARGFPPRQSMGNQPNHKKYEYKCKLKFTYKYRYRLTFC